MPFLSRKRSVKQILSQRDNRAPESTQKSDSSVTDLNSLLTLAHISLHDDCYSCENVFDSLCELRRVLSNKDQSAIIVKDIEDQCVSEDNLVLLLKPITECSDDEDHEKPVSSLNQDSVCRLLLRVQSIQNGLITVLLSKITEHSDEECEHDSVISLLLNQFRWLDFVSDCSSLVTGLLDILSICSKSVQKEILNLLPEIVHDNLQETCVRELITFLQTDSSLCSIIITTLENLRLSEKQYMDNLTVFTESLTTVNLVDLGKVVRFLLCTCPIPSVLKNSSECLNVMNLVRKSCDILKWIETEKEKEIGESLFEELYSCFQQRPELSKVYMKLLNQLSIEEILSIDIWIIAILLKEDLQLFQIERVFTHRCYRMSPESSIFHTAIHSNGVSLQPVFKQLIKIAEIMAKTSSLVTQGFSRTVFIECWNEYKHPYYQQEIISSLLTLIGSSSISYKSASLNSTPSSSSYEVTVALSTLQVLAENKENERDLQKYLVFIRGILDYSERLSVSQTVILLNILCKLASAGNQGESSSMNELFILIRKYLGMSDSTHRKMGVLGCCSIMQHYRGDVESVHNIFHFCLKSTRNFPEIRLFFYQRLVYSIENELFQRDLVEFVNSEMAGLLDEMYFGDIPARGEVSFVGQTNSAIHPELAYNLQEKSRVYVNLYKFVSASSLRQKQQAFLLPSLLRLVVTTEKYLSPADWLKNVNAVISCPIVTSGDVVMDELNTGERDIVMVNKLAIILFLKEIVNVYSNCDDQEVRYIVCQRIALLTELVENFNKLFPTYGLPFVPVGMESFVKLSEKGSKTSNSIQIPPYSPGAIKLLLWNQLHIVRSDDLLKLLPISEMHFPFLSVSSLSLALGDLYYWTAQLQGNPMNRTKKLEQIEVFHMIESTLNKEILASLSSLLSLLYQVFCLSDTDLEGNVNDDHFRIERVYPLLVIILKIFTSLLTCSSYRDSVYRSNVVLITRSLCCGSATIKPREFILVNEFDNETLNDENSNKNGLETRFYSVNQISPFIEAFYDKVKELMKSLSGFEKTIACLQFLESLAYYQLDMHLRLKGDQEKVHIDNVKSRDIEIMNDLIVLEESGISQLLYSLSDLSIDILKEEQFATKPSSTVMKNTVGYLIRVHIVYAKERDIRLAALVEAVTKYNEVLYEESVVKNAPDIRNASKPFLCISKENFHSFFSATFAELIRVIVNINIEETILVSDDNCKEIIARIKRLFALLEAMVTVTKRNEKQNILTCTIKNFGLFMSFFLERCWMFLTKLLVRFSSEVVFIVKIIQRCTRQIQSLCAHAKIVKDASMMSFVPKIKKQLEQMIYLIKETLKKEGAEDAFWLGNLKNRYLNGKEVTEEEDRLLSERKRGRKERNVEKVEKRPKVKEEVKKTIVEEEAMEAEEDETEDSSQSSSDDSCDSSNENENENENEN